MERQHSKGNGREILGRAPTLGRAKQYQSGPFVVTYIFL